MRIGVVWFVVLVVLEVWSIAKLSDYVGFWATLVLLAAGFIFGLKLMRGQGLGAIMQAAQSRPLGESPLAPVAAAIVRAFAGILFIIPGFISDLAAFIILLPFVQNAFARHLAQKGQLRGFAAGRFGGAFAQAGFGGPEFANRGANKDRSGGQMYEHDAGANASGGVIDGQVIEHKSEL